jgi:hypothetical protein
MKKEEALERQIQEYERNIAEIYQKLNVIPKDLPKSNLEGLLTIRPPQMTTTHKPHDRQKITKHAYLRETLNHFRILFNKIKEKEDKYSEF